jgi:hypothetical protein
MFVKSSETLFGLGEELLSEFLEDDTTKKPVAAPVVPVVTAAPIAADIPAVVEPVKEEVVEAVIADEVPVTEVTVNDEKVAEPTTDVVTAEKVESDSVNEVVPVETVVETLTSELVPEVAADTASVVPVVTSAPVAPVKATSEEEESLIDGIVNTLVFDDTDDGKSLSLKCDKVFNF